MLSAGSDWIIVWLCRCNNDDPRTAFLDAIGYIRNHTVTILSEDELCEHLPDEGKIIAVPAGDTDAEGNARLLMKAAHGREVAPRNDGKMEGEGKTEAEERTDIDARRGGSSTVRTLPNGPATGRSPVRPGNAGGCRRLGITDDEQR